MQVPRGPTACTQRCWPRLEVASQSDVRRLIRLHGHLLSEPRQNWARDELRVVVQRVHRHFRQHHPRLVPALPVVSLDWHGNPWTRGMNVCTLLRRFARCVVNLSCLVPGTCPTAAHKSPCAAAPSSSKPPTSRGTSCNNVLASRGRPSTRVPSHPGNHALHLCILIRCPHACSAVFKSSSIIGSFSGFSITYMSSCRPPLLMSRLAITCVLSTASSKLMAKRSCALRAPCHPPRAVQMLLHAAPSLHQMRFAPGRHCVAAIAAVLGARCLAPFILSYAFSRSIP